MRRQFVLDERTDQLLDRLAASRAGNRSYVVREAIALYAGLEDRLAEIEADPDFQKLMSRTDEEIQRGRTLSNAQVRKRSRQRR